MNRRTTRPISPARERPARDRRAWSLLLVLLLALGLTAAPRGVGGRVAAQVDASGIEGALAAFDESIELLQRLRGTIDPASHDVGALGLELAFEDPEAIAAFVQAAVAYQPYAGVLRGPEGTWEARAGNALDQALLLARLLVDAGYDAEVALATVPEAAARDVLALVRPAGAPAGVDWDDAGVEPEALVDDPEALERAVAATGARLAELAAQVDATAGWLERQLGDSWSEPNALEATLLAEASAYAWVRARLFEGDAWISLHPVFADAPTWTTSLEPERTLQGSVPDDLLHRFRLEAFVERRVGGDVEVTPLFPAWERPVANLVGVPLVTGFAPDGLEGDELVVSDVTAASEATVFFAPVLNGAPITGADMFDRLGNQVDPMAAASPMGGLFGQLGNLGNEATQELGGDGIELASVWWQYTFVHPDGREIVHRRPVLDRVHPDDRAAGVVGELAPSDAQALFEALATSQTLMLAPADVAAGTAERVRLDAQLALAGYQRSVWLESVAPEGRSLEVPATTGTALARDRLTTAYAAFADHDVPEGAVGYRHEPALVVVSSPLAAGRSVVDVVQNPRRVLTLGGTRPLPAAALQAGVWETATERLALRASDPTAVIDAFAFADAADAAGVGWRALGAGEAAPAGLPAGSRAAIAADLAAGYVVVAPASLPAGIAEAAWWRVDPATGVALGRAGDGRGQAATEYSNMQMFVAGQLFSQSMNVAGFGACRAGGGSNACCAGDAAVGTALGIGIGFAIGAKLAQATALGAGMLLDVGALGLGVGGVLPSFC
jgi:hypothetical protein